MPNALYKDMLRLAVTRPRVLLMLPSIAWRFRRRDWYRRWPFLPVPSSSYLEWRMHTAFGDAGVKPTADQLERYLRWVHAMRQH